MISHVHHQTPLNVSHMSEKQWYQLLLESKVTMTETDESIQLIPCRAEIRNPGYDWESTWSRARMSGLGSELISFLLKVLHDLLPTQERIARTNPAVNGDCTLCVPNVKEDLVHALIRCPGNQGTVQSVLDCLLLTGVQDQDVLHLQIDLEEHLQLPVVFILAVVWSMIWESRRLGRRPELYKVRAELEARVSLLRETRRHAEAADEITSIISNL